MTSGTCGSRGGRLSLHGCCDVWVVVHPNIQSRGIQGKNEPGRYRRARFTPPTASELLRAALVASCFRGAFPPVDLRAVCLVRAMSVSCAHSTHWCFGVWGFGVFVQVPAALVALLITQSANLANLHQIHLGHPGHLGRVYLQVV